MIRIRKTRHITISDAVWAKLEALAASCPRSEGNCSAYLASLILDAWERAERKRKKETL